ncbi:apolipoprotein Bb, tandem duplicate 1 [Nothobranchius furzeri]|uniref:Apolipoprotein Bb, tandem duplicate 1 n=6 Tax=Nothobranchius furzeri TaxID=105023 RepID=A0A8C6MFU7_NOTFU
MGDSKLCLLLLLATSALAFAQDEDQPTCPLAERFKTLHKYEYQYEAESLNGISGASRLKNGPKASCKVEVEVPRTCSFIVRTTGCTLSEVVDADAEGNPVFSPASNSDDFAADMAKSALKVVVDGEYNVKLYPEDGETTNILNFKRGIISALAIPLLEEDRIKVMPTIHGKCKTYYTVNAREDIATDINLNRDLSRCEKFVPIRDHNSPLALITGMHYPLSQLVRSSQTCNYKFDNEKKHMTSGSCTENHLLIPFSHRGKYGVTNVGKQKLTLVDVSTHNDRVFDQGHIIKSLHMEDVEDKSAVQDKDTALNVMRELLTLPMTESEKRAHLFHTLISTVRGMKTETLRAAIPEAVTLSRFLTYQVLAQCGTPECSSAIMMILRTFDTSTLEVDAAVIALGIMSNPSPLLIHDMLEMAKYKPSKPIMYALSNVVKRFYKAEGELIPEINSVAEFMASQLGDCTSNQDSTFLTLRVVGNMAPALIPASPALQSAVINCVRQPAASQQVQQAAIQVYRQIPVPDDAKGVFMQVLLDNSKPVQERIAAYLILMKDPELSELTQLNKVLSSEEGQVKSFIISHISNIMSSTDPKTQELKQNIQDALQGNEIEPLLDPIRFSRNYRIGSLQGNMIFEGASYLPKEIMLEMTLKAFGFEIDMMEVGMEGKGFEETIEALFGENGFFPDTTMKTTYFVSDNMPQTVNEILETIVPGLKKNRMRRQTSESLMKDIGQNVDKLVRQLKESASPEAMVYLRLLGNELGYLKTSDFEEMTYSAGKIFDNMLKLFPQSMIKSLMTNPDNKIFAHYVFMDNEFFLPTVTGVPLRIAVSGTFAPGFEGGLQIRRDRSTFTFMPSPGVEFSTHFGSHFPEYVNSGLEMHTNIYTEREIRAKLSLGSNNIKLTIPAPTKPMKLIKMTNALVAVTGSEVKTIPPVVMDKVDVSKCTNGFAGLKLCTDLQYINAFSQETAPYFPLTGDSKFALELHPNGDVTEYTATIAYELLQEVEGEQKVDSLKFIMRAEGADPTEARLVLKLNRNKNFATADIKIPDYDVDAGLTLGVVDGPSKDSHAISLDFTNKNISQLSLVARANLKATEGMFQVQTLVPSVKAESSITASLKYDEELELELESEMKIMDATSEQKIELKYDGSKIKVKGESDVNMKTSSFENYANEVLDIQVGQTDMKVRQIFRKFVEAANNYMEKYGPEMLPYMKDFRLPDIPEISLPEKLFLKSESKAVYYLSREHFTIAIPLPFGGKSTTELHFPKVLTTPSLSLPQFGVEIASRKIPIPDVVFPESFSLSFPLFDKAEFSAMVNSNLYDVEATAAAGKDVVEPPSYSARFDLKGTSPIDILSVAVEGTGMVSMRDAIKAHLRSSFTHKFVEATFGIEEEGIITDKINLKSVRKIEVTSPFGLDVALIHTGMAEINTQGLSGDSKFEGLLSAGPIFSKTISTQSFAIFPFKPEAKIESTLQLDSTILKAQNTVAASLANGEVSFVSNTNAFENAYTHVADISFKNSQLKMKCESNFLAFGIKIRNLGEASAGAGKVAIRMETNGDHSGDRVYSLLIASLDKDGVAVSCDANIKLLEHEATHKVILQMNKNGLSTSGITTLHGPLSLENTFKAHIDSTMAILSHANKADISDVKVDNSNTLILTLSGLDLSSKTEASASEYASYTHDIIFKLKPYTASLKCENSLNILDVSFSNEAQLLTELYKIDLSGNLRATYGDNEIKHDYQIKYADLSTNAKCSTTARLFGTHMSHNSELEIVGLAAKFINDARFYSQPIRFDNSIQWSAVPFDFNLNAIFNANGEMTMYGKQSGQLYGKYQLAAQPLAFASSHECRASVTQQMDHGFSLETIYDHKINTVLSPQEQKTSLRIKSKVNEHSFNQNMEVYNTADETGIELSGTILTDFFNTENKEFTLSGFLKYDKNTDSHIIQFPLMESFPIFLESVKEFVVFMAETLHNFMENQNVQARLEALIQAVNEFLSDINIADKVNQLKRFLIDLTPDFNLQIDQLKALFYDSSPTIERLLKDTSDTLRSFFENLREAFHTSNVVESFNEKVDDIANALADIKPVVLHWIDVIRELIDQTDLEKLKGTSIQLLYDLNSQYNIKAKVQDIVTDIRETVDSFDAEYVVKNLGELIRFIEDVFLECIGAFLHYIPRDILHSLRPYINTVVEELDIFGKINYVYTKMKELLVYLEIDKMSRVVLEKAADLVSELRIKEMFQALDQNVRNANIPKRIRDFYVAVGEYVTTTEVKDMIEQLNTWIKNLVNQLKSLKYNEVVNYANLCVAEITTYVNKRIKAFEIPKKLEATQEFVNEVFSAVQVLVEHIREIKVAEMIKSAKDVIETVVCDSFKRFVQLIKKKIESMDIRKELSNFVDDFRQLYRFSKGLFLSLIHDLVRETLRIFKKVSLDGKFVDEISDMFNRLFAELRNGDVYLPSFTIPLTDLVVPHMKLNSRNTIEFAAKVDLPEFTILGMYKVKAITISFDDIKQKIIELLDFIANFEIKLLDVDAFFGDLSLSYLPTLPEIRLPEFTVPEVTFPTIPKFPVESLKSLEVPEFKLPTISDEIMIPCFGKLYGEIKFSSPFYTVKTSAEFHNATKSKTTPLFTGIFNSQGTAADMEFLNYKLETNAQIVIPKLKRVVLAENLKFEHVVFGVDHQASVTLYGLSAQAQAKTKLKVDTTPYAANLENTAFIGADGGMTAHAETAYTHVISIPVVDFSNEVSITQKSVARQEGFTYEMSADNSGNGNFNGHDFNHLSEFRWSLSPEIVTFSLSGDTNSPILKMKQLITTESATFSYFKFNVSNEAETPVMRKSLFVASGHASIQDMKIEMKANHDAELISLGLLSNVFNFKLRPVEFVLEFQNKANARVPISDSLTNKIDFQNDYLVDLRPDGQKMKGLFLAQLNTNKIASNLTYENNRNEIGASAAMEGYTDLDFLNVPIDIPQIDLLLEDELYIPAVKNVNFYELIGLQNILTTTKQDLNVDAKILYQKSKSAPLVKIMNLIPIPSMGKLITDFSFKSAIFNLNTNTLLSPEDDVVLRLKANTASVFDYLNAKFEGTTSLITKRGIKLANSLSLQNPHIEGTHTSTISMSTDTFEGAASVDSLAKITLPVLNLEASHNLVADIKSKANAQSILKLKSDLNIHRFNAIGKAEADHTLKLEGNVKYISAESIFKSNMNGAVFRDYLSLGLLDNEVKLYLDGTGLRSSSKATAVARLSHGTTKIVLMEMNNNVAAEASMARIFATLKHTSNNEENIFKFTTKGSHNIQAGVDLTSPSMTTDIEIDLSQQSNLGDLTYFEKTITEVTSSKQKFFTDIKFGSPLYSTRMEAKAECSVPDVLVTFKSSATSPVLILEYDLNAQATSKLENGLLTTDGKLLLTHSDVTVNVNNAIVKNFRRKRQADQSDLGHTLNVDITSPTFTDMNIQYTANRDVISASVSTPAAGFLGLQLNFIDPFQMSGKLYGRHPTIPEKDVDILVIRTSKDTQNTNLEIVYKMDAPEAMISELKAKLPSIISAFTAFADKYQITRGVDMLKDTVSNHITEAYNVAVNYDVQKSQMSIFFRNTVAQYQKTVQKVLNAIIKFLRETHIKLPWSDEMITVPVLLKRVTDNLAFFLDEAAQIIYENTKVYLEYLAEMISNVEVHIPTGDVITGRELIDETKTMVREIWDEVLDFVKDMDSLDIMLEQMDDIVMVVVRETQDIVDSIKSDYLDYIFMKVNEMYSEIVTAGGEYVDQIDPLSMEDFRRACEGVVDNFFQLIQQFKSVFSEFLQDISKEVNYMTVRDGKLNINLPLDL